MGDTAGEAGAEVVLAAAEASAGLAVVRRAVAERAAAGKGRRNFVCTEKKI